MLCLEGFHDLRGTPQDEAGFMRKFETSHVGGATCRTPPIPRSALEKDPRPGPLFEGNPVGEGTTMKRVASPGSMHDTGCLGLVHWDDPEGWNGEGGGRKVQDGEHMYT